MSATVPPTRITPAGVVVARIGPDGHPWVVLRGDRERGQAFRDLTALRFAPFNQNPSSLSGAARRRVPRETTAS